MDEKLQAKLAAMFHVAIGALSKNGEVVLALLVLNEFSDEELDLIDEVAEKYSFKESKVQDDD